MIDSPHQGETDRPGIKKLVLSLVALLLLGPMAYKHAPREVARWYQAMAVEQFDHGREDEAERSMENAIRWSPEDGRLYLQIARWRRVTGRYAEALEWCGKARLCLGHESDLLEEETQILWSMKRWDEALALWKRAAAEASDGGRLGLDPTLLNSLAYARALANTELDDALRDINDAIGMLGGNPGMLDTRGFIQFHRGELGEALRDLDAALRQLDEPASTDLQRSAEPKGSADPKGSAESKASSEPKGSADSKGSTDPKGSAESKGSAETSGKPLSPPSATKRNWPQSRAVRERERNQEQTLAVLLYHRMLILEKQGETAKAAVDRKRIESLGYRPDDSLF